MIRMMMMMMMMMMSAPVKWFTTASMISLVYPLAGLEPVQKLRLNSLNKV